MSWDERWWNKDSADITDSSGSSHLSRVNLLLSLLRTNWRLVIIIISWSSIVSRYLTYYRQHRWCGLHHLINLLLPIFHYQDYGPQHNPDISTGHTQFSYAVISIGLIGFGHFIANSTGSFWRLLFSTSEMHLEIRTHNYSNLEIISRLFSLNVDESHYMF